MRLLALLALCLTLSSCTTLNELRALSQVDFAINDVNQTRLAGVNIDNIRSYEDVGALDAIRIANAVRNKELPFNFTLNLVGENPESNQTQARMVSLDWTLFLEDRETISGVFNDEVVLPPGSPVNIPISMEVDLYRFFGDNLPDLVDLALSISGQGGAPKNIRLNATPSINTPIGPIRYPGEITIVSRQVGG
ncbi:MAG: hypothetical protein AAGI08_16035 [Bacteroidota bacterium]